MTQYHINRNTKLSGVCTAQPGQCPVSDSENHFDSEEEAKVQSERMLAAEHNPMKSLSKARITLQSVKINEVDYAHPEASLKNVDKLALLLKEKGELTAREIAKTHNVVDRQGKYQADALGYLGLAETHINPKTREKIYSLNTEGKAYASLSEAERQEVMINIVREVPLLKKYEEYGEAGAMSYVKTSKQRARKENAELGDARKVEVIKAWSTQTSNGDNFLNEDYVYEKTEKPTEKIGEICSKCFIAKPLSGVCPNCEE